MSLGQDVEVVVLVSSNFGEVAGTMKFRKAAADLLRDEINEVRESLGIDGFIWFENRQGSYYMSEMW